MSDRPIPQETDAEVHSPAPVWVGPSMRVTKEQLAAAERTRDYHARKLQNAFAGAERSGEAPPRSEH